MLCSVQAWAAEGDLDPTFGSGGTVVTPFAGGPSVARGMVIDAQGRIIVVGAAIVSNGNDHSDMAIARYLPSGGLDPSFSADGLATVDFPAADTSEGANAVAVDSRGGILVAGFRQTALMGSSEDFALVRLGDDGAVDASFGSSGYATKDLHDADEANGIAVDAQGRIILAGSTHFATDDDFGVARFDANGQPDSAFGAGGDTSVDFTSGPGDDDYAKAVAVDVQGRIVLVGTSQTNFGVARLNGDGSPDPSFGSVGYVTTSVGGVGDHAVAMAIDPQGRVLAGGLASVGGGSQFALVRYNDNASLDATFSDDGKVLTPVADTDDVDGLAIDGQGRIVASGTAADPSNNTSSAVVRYQTNGAVDPSFGQSGIARVGDSLINSFSVVALDDHDRIVVARTVGSGPGLKFGLFRLIGDAVAPTAKIASGPADGDVINDSTPTFEFSSSEAGGTFACGFDNLSGSCASPFKPSARLGDGKHTFSLTATDRAGNSTAALSRTFTIDTKAPEIEIKGKKKVKTHRPKARDKLRIKTSEPAELTCTVDKKKPEDCVAKFITPKLTEGKHKVTVTATDQAGNSSDEAKKIKVVTKP
jgi:uncharacterized delta-60 repeat protein